MHDIVTAFVERVAQVSDCRVVLGPPSRDAFHEEAVRVWPWRITEDLALHASPHSQATGREAPPVTVHCLVMSANLQALERLRMALHATPVVDAGGSRVHVSPEALGHDALVGLFAAAAVAPVVCLPYALRATAA